MSRRAAWAVSLLALVVLGLLPLVLTRDLITALFFTFVFVTLAATYDLRGGVLR